MRPNISSVFPPAYAIAVSNSIKDDDDDDDYVPFTTSSMKKSNSFSLSFSAISSEL